MLNWTESTVDAIFGCRVSMKFTFNHHHQSGLYIKLIVKSLKGHSTNLTCGPDYWSRGFKEGPIKGVPQLHYGKCRIHSFFLLNRLWVPLINGKLILTCNLCHTYIYEIMSILDIRQQKISDHFSSFISTIKVPLQSDLHSDVWAEGGKFLWAHLKSLFNTWMYQQDFWHHN